MMKGTRRFLQNIVGNGADSQSYIKGTGHFIAEAADGRSINNLWTGKALGGAGRKVTAVGLAGGIGVYSLIGPGQVKEKEFREIAKEDDIQSLQSTQADGSGYTAFPSFSMHDYAPSGDLVFALHKLRHGG